MKLANVNELKNKIPEHVTIVAATKYVDSLDMRKLFAAGIHHFGENRVDSFLKKKSELTDLPIVWHFIGHLQRNKVRQVINEIDYLHSLDSIELAQLIRKERKTPLKCFIEININEEESKTGLPITKLDEMIKEVKNNPMIELIGFMGMSKRDTSSEEKYEQFKMISDLMKQMNEKHQLNMTELSMGMSEDFEEAIKAGATMVRLGRILWMQES